MLCLSNLETVAFSPKLASQVVLDFSFIFLKMAFEIHFGERGINPQFKLSIFVQLTLK